MKTKEQLLEKICYLEIIRMRLWDSADHCRTRAHHEYTSDYGSVGNGDAWTKSARFWEKKEERIANRIHKLVFRNTLGFSLKNEYDKIKAFLSRPQNKEMILSGQNRKDVLMVHNKLNEDFFEKEFEERQ